MATGGIFTIITNDGKQDRMLMATALLHERLRSINAFNQSKNGGMADALSNLPTLLDIEKTHVLFTNAHFKPFAAIGFEYNKVRSTAGNPALGQSVQFSIPQFGDFFHDVCGHVILLQPTLNSTATTISDAPLMRWCAFPGEALFQNVQMEVNGNPLDQYTFHATNLHREYRVAPNKILGWNRCVGQEEVLNGFAVQPSWANNGVATSAITSRMVTQTTIGNQTPTGQKDQSGASNLEMFIPLLFWYNKDVRLAVPSVAIPYGQRFININLATLAQLVGVVPRGAGTWAVPLGSISESTPTLQTIELYINNIFVNPEVHKIYIKRIGFSLIRVHRQQLYNANTSKSEVLLQQLKWPIEYLMVGMKVSAYFSGTALQTNQFLADWQRFSFVSENVYSTQGQCVQQQSSLFTRTAAGTPVSTSIATTGVLTFTSTSGTLTQALPVGSLVQIAGNYYAVSVAGTAGGTTCTLVPAPAAALTTGTDSNSYFFNAATGLQMTGKRLYDTVDNVSITAHGIKIYDNYNTKFFNAYTSYHYGGPNINTPTDSGLVFIPFCLYPGTYQPSGHINVSRAREFYLNYDSSVIGTTPASGSPYYAASGSTLYNQAVNGTLVVVASAINFLLISDGSAVLRYST